MNDMNRNRWVVGVLSAALVISFILCVASDLRFSATLNDAGIVLPASAGILALGFSWLLGHGLHGAVVVAVPLFYLMREKSSAGVADSKPSSIDTGIT